jgi:hypothetical protein
MDKLCVKCKIEKPISEFYIKKNGRPHSWCNKCRKEVKRNWDISHVNERKEYNIVNKDRNNQKDRERRERDSAKYIATYTKYNELNREKRRQANRLNPNYKKHRKEYEKKWREENSEHLSIYFKEYYEKDAAKKALRNLRGKVRKLLKGEVSPVHSNDLVGCSFDFFKQHIESQFTEGMLWSNYGFGADKWNIHHTPPLASYDYSVEGSYHEAFHWTHLSPKWTLENISENSNYNGVRYYYKKEKL